MSHAIVSAAIVAYVLVATWMMLCVTMHATRGIHRGNVAVSLPLGVLGVALASYLTIVIVFLSPNVGRFVIAAGWIAVAAYFVKARAWRIPREAVAVFVLTVAVLLVHLGLLYLWQYDGGFWLLAETRFLAGALPSDNTLPALLAERIGLGEPTHFFAGDWNGSDRPPLQAGVILLLAGPAVLLGEASTGAAAASLVAQALWIPAAYGVLGALRVHPRVAMMALTFAALTSTIIVNSVFTWPKLLAASLVLAAIALLLSLDSTGPRRRWLFVAAVAASTLGLLAHGGSAFVLPTVIIIAVWKLRRRGVASLAKDAMWGAVALVGLYAPWLLFQRFVDPPGDRLLKWHLAGVIPVTDESFSSVFRNAYGSLSFGEIVANKWANLRQVFDVDLLRGLYPPETASRAARNGSEFVFTSNALGPAALILIAMAVFALVTRVRRRSLGAMDRRLMLACAVMVPSLVAWTLVMFGPATTVVHQGSHVWIIVFLTVPFAWLTVRFEWAGWIVIGLQVWLAFYFLGPSWVPSVVRPWGVATLLAGVVIIGVAHLLVRTGEGAQDRPEQLAEV